MIIWVCYEVAVNLIYPILAILYLLLPYDLLPDALVGWGWIDDIIILWFLWRYLLRFYGTGRKDREEKRAQSSKNTNADDGTRSYGAAGENNRESAGKTEMHDPYQILGIAPGASSHTSSPGPSIHLFITGRDVMSVLSTPHRRILASRGKRRRS